MTKHATWEHPPAPGLDGTHRDSCVVCLQGTDTGLSFTGPAEWAIAGLNHVCVRQSNS